MSAEDNEASPSAFLVVRLSGSIVKNMDPNRINAIVSACSDDELRSKSCCASDSWECIERDN